MLRYYRRTHRILSRPDLTQVRRGIELSHRGSLNGGLPRIGTRSRRSPRRAPPPQPGGFSGVQVRERRFGTARNRHLCADNADTREPMYEPELNCQARPQGTDASRRRSLIMTTKSAPDRSPKKVAGFITPLRIGRWKRLISARINYFASEGSPRAIRWCSLHLATWRHQVDNIESTQNKIVRDYSTVATPPYCF